MPKPLTESVNLAEASTSTTDDAGLLEVEFITPGWGSSGYYSPKVIEAAAPLFAVGTHMYFDHPTETEHHERPGRSVRDLAAVIIEAGVVNKATGGIRGKVKPLAPYRELLTDEAFASNVGVSIRASASDIVVGEAEGRRGPIIEGLVEVDSVDFVTRAGRGGKVLAVLESARHADVHEATASDRHQQLQRAVRAEHDGTNGWVYVRDHDADERVVWFEISGEGPTETWQQTYDVGANDVDITLTGEPTRVSALTTYVPVTRPDSTIPTTESQEDTMPKIQIEEAEHARLTETAGRVDALESENVTLKAERDQLREADATRVRTDRAREIVADRAKEAGVEFTALEARGLIADLPIKDGALDEDAFTTTVDENATAKKSPGTGVKGFGASAQTTEESATERPTTTPWGRPLTVKGA
ncbi:hypothetical protein NPS01_25440 [Nocardioides psychrotolerans]|uniref:Uncharacterized protein n=1 Tax=Nocardioides psychrotolerans TaxID=1005945 RepID=A0A1I3LPG2_9ACTN|nr:hypothetical protein [Nocardioides psychrotolerans]GEP38881.1 hypothetical protein NPS01_25440 [Nocardioides psychrotolerans]SFI86659.1 hypothetical protein SAMN05216561_11449 [Nocardioides psychrotolerans]